MSVQGEKATDLKNVVLWAAGPALLVLFGLLVWPTLYRYDHIDLGLGRSYPVRQNRINGQTEILFPDGWKDSRDSHPSNSGEDLSTEELAKLEILPRLRGPGPSRGWDRIEANVYNGLPDIDVSEITLEITVSGPKNEPIVIARRYRLLPPLYGGARALQTGNYSISLGFDILQGQSWSYVVVGAKGKKT
jgi:hypothetical protein